EGGAAHLDRQAGNQRGVASDVEPLLAELVDAAEDDVLDLGGIDLEPRGQIFQHERREIIRANVRELSTLPPNTSAHAPDNDCIQQGHPQENRSSNSSSRGWG